MPGGSCTKLEGDGDPHQWILHKQLSEKRDCGDSYCLVANVHEIDFAIGANTHGSDWFSGDFAVESEIHTGLSNLACTGGGNQPGNSVCSYAVIWHTDYTVRTGVANSCALDGCQEGPDTNIIRSPNSIHDSKIEYYCAWDDACGEQGQENWIAGPAMGPPAPAAVNSPASAPLIERQNCLDTDCTSLEGNGDPHQWILRKQLSDTLICEGTGDDGCGMVTETDQLAYELYADTKDAGAWIDGGFAVEQSLWTGKYWGDCPGNPGDRVCVWAEIWHTDVSASYVYEICFGCMTDPSLAVHRPWRPQEFLRW